MSKRKGKNDIASSSAGKKPHNGFYTPFRDLDQHLGANISSTPEYCDKPAPELENLGDLDECAGENDELLFVRAMAEVNPLPARKQKKIPLRPPDRNHPRFLAREEAEALAELVDLVAGEGPFELSCSDEYIDGAIIGISPDVLKKLRNGYFSYQDHLDLHGLNRQQARAETTDFIMRSFSARRRCVLIIPGRGLNSRDKEPILKNSLVSWLTRAPLKRVVLAFASARSYDGGWGAFYVLLRGNEGKAPLVTPAR
ncbi:MAG: Smr/MutS family protein [Syntrophobacter sp.]